MQKKQQRLNHYKRYTGLFFSFIFLAAVQPVFAFNYNNIPASLVVGQPDFTSNTVNQGVGPQSYTLRTPAGHLVINGKLIVADSQNNRVLIWNQFPTTNNAPADVVLGRHDFTTPGGPFEIHTYDRPSGVASDGEKLIVLDRDNYRVLIYNQIPTTNFAPADVVIGQPDMNTHTYGQSEDGNVSASKLSSGPAGLWYDNDTGKLFVYDNDNNRVLIWNQLPTTNGVAADVVIGQPDMTTAIRNPPVNERTLDLSTANGVTTYQGKLLIADRKNHRILIWNQIPTTNYAPADVVVGQPDFTSELPNQGGAISSRGFNGTRVVRVDNQGKMYVGEMANARIMIWNQIPTTNNAPADVVIGQPDFTTNNISVTAKTLGTELNVISFPNGQLLVSDLTNNRVLYFTLGKPTFGTITSSSVEVQQSSIVAGADESQYDWQVRRNNTTELGMNRIATSSVIDTGLVDNTAYTYDFQLQDNTSNIGDYGEQATVYTHARTPSGLNASAISNNRITLSVDSFTNDTVGSSGYFFSNTTTGTSSGWIQTNSWQDTGLASCVLYTYSVKYRNSQGAETNTASMTTNGCGVVFIPSTVASSGAGVVIPPSVSVINTPRVSSVPQVVKSVIQNAKLEECNTQNTSVARKGHRGVLVKKIQQTLNEMKIGPLLAEDGILGNRSIAAIVNAQKILGVKQDGIWGPHTQNAYEIWKKSCFA